MLLYDLNATWICIQSLIFHKRLAVELQPPQSSCLKGDLPWPMKSNMPSPPTTVTLILFCLLLNDTATESKTSKINISQCILNIILKATTMKTQVRMSWKIQSNSSTGMDTNKTIYSKVSKVFLQINTFINVEILSFSSRSCWSVR